MAGADNGEKGQTDSKRTLMNNILLLLVGSIITLTSSFLTTEFSSKNEDKRKRVQQQLEFADNLSKYLAMKYYVVGSFGRARLSNDPRSIKVWEKKYQSFDTITVNNTYYFPAHLRILFGPDYEKHYIDSIRSPFDTLELYLTDKPVKQFDTVKLNQYNNLDYVMKRFTVLLYDKAYNEKQ